MVSKKAIVAVTAVGIAIGGGILLAPALQPSQFTVIPQSQSITILQGKIGSIPARVVQTSGIPKRVEFAWFPVSGGIQFGADPSIGTPPFDTVLNFVVPATTPVGTYDCKIRASSDEYVRDFSILVYVESTTPILSKFSLSLDRADVTIAQGTSTTVTCTVTQLTGPAKIVGLTFYGPPITGIFNPVQALAPFTSTLTIAAPATAQVGSYPAEVRGFNDEMSEVKPMLINVVEAAPPAMGKLVVEAYGEDPWGYRNPVIAHITVNPGNLTADTPATFTLSPRTYTVEAVLAEKRQTKSAQIVAGQTTTVTFDFY